MDKALNRLLTIVIPVYNVAEFLPQCFDSLESFIGQIIIVNDGSTDDSPIICQEFACRHKNVIIIEKKNGGLSDARNIAFSYIKTDYVFFLDSDDWINCDVLIRALIFTIENKFDWVQCGYVYEYSDHSVNLVESNIPKKLSKATVLESLVSDGYIKNFVWGKIYRASVILDFKFPIGKYFEDVLWQYKVVNGATSFAVYPEVVTHYRQRDSSISGQFSDRHIDLIDGMIDRLNYIIQCTPQLADVAALNLWRSIRLFVRIARGTSVRDIFSQRLITVENQYRRYIQSGIRRCNGLEKFTLNMILSHNSFAHTFELFSKILNYMQK